MCSLAVSTPNPGSGNNLMREKSQLYTTSPVVIC